MRPFPKKSAPKLLFPSFNRNLKKGKADTAVSAFLFPFASTDLRFNFNFATVRTFLVGVDFPSLVKEQVDAGVVQINVL